MSSDRLDKILSDCGFCSRSEAKKFIGWGRITVNGKVVRDPALKFNTEEITVAFKNKPIDIEATKYIMLYKPAGVLSATEEKNGATVLDLLTPELKNRGLFPVGRLDKDTTGLLILTNDGDYCHRVTSPKHHVSKVYLASCDKPFDDSDILSFENGIVLRDGTEFLPAKLEILPGNLGKITVYEGKFHQVKKMTLAVGKEVQSLKRLSIGSLYLDESLSEGEYRELTEEEREAVFIEPCAE